MFVFSATFKLFGAETRVTEIRQAPKIWPYSHKGFIALAFWPKNTFEDIKEIKKVGHLIELFLKGPML
jgi:hypothetical protein